MRKLTTQDFITKATYIHQNKYDYSKTNYVNSRTKVTIICPIHSEFEQLPYSHLSGKGCPKCGKIKSNSKKRLTIDEIIHRASKVHNNKYEYNIKKYNSIDNKMKINLRQKIFFKMDIGLYTIVVNQFEYINNR